MLKFYVHYGDEKVKIPVHKCKKPKFKDHGGRTWDYGRFTINGKEVKAYLDTTWGEFMYFEWEGSWRRVRMQQTIIDEIKTGRTWDIDPFGHPEFTAVD